MSTCSTRRVVVLLAGLALASVAGAQPRSTSVLARELVSLLEGAKLDSMATRDGDSERFVAALYIPKQQLIVVSGRYAAPALLREKILLKRYRDVYLDLYSASDAASRTVVEDGGADGIQASLDGGTSMDIFTRGTAQAFPFDGAWKERRIAEQVYRDMVATADRDYARMLQALIDQARGSAPGRSEP